MTSLDPVLRRLKANVALRMRKEAADLTREADYRLAHAQVIEHTWDLEPMTSPDKLPKIT